MRLAAKQPETAKERSDDAQRGLRTDTRDASNARAGRSVISPPPRIPRDSAETLTRPFGSRS